MRLGKKKSERPGVVVGKVPEKFEQKRKLSKTPVAIIALVAGMIGICAIIYSLAAPTTSLTKIYGVNNAVGWGGIASAHQQLGVNGDRTCQDETNLDTTLTQEAAQGMYFTVCVNTDEGLSSLNKHSQDYASLVANQASMYGPGGTYWNNHSQYSQYAVQTFEIMNEPYGWWFRGGDNDPAAYAHIAAAAIRAGHAANPQAKFYIALAPEEVKLSNGTWVDWNKALLQAEPDLFNLADGFSIHLYYTPTEFMSVLDQHKIWAWSQPGGNGKPFVITEANLTDQQASPEADYISAIPQFVQIAQNRDWVKELFIFSWHGYTGRDYLGFLNVAGVARQGRIDAYHAAVQQAMASNPAPPPTPPSTDTTKPTVSLTAPSQNSTVSGQVTISANASDSTSVSRVEFYADGTLISTDTSSPYTATWNSTSAVAGAHTITAKAYDPAGNTGTDTRNVTVQPPATTPVSGSDLLFNGNFSALDAQALLDQNNTGHFSPAGTQTYNIGSAKQYVPGHVTIVPDPLGSGEKVVKMVVANTDVSPLTPTENPRAQLIGPNNINKGDDVWVKTKLLLPSDFPSTVPGWMSLVAIYGEPFAGSGPWEIAINGNHFEWDRNGTYRYDVPWSMPYVKNQWITILLHEKFDTNGSVQMWINGQQVTFFDKSAPAYYNPGNLSQTTTLNMQTMDSSNNGGPNAAKVALYRQKNILDSVTTYFGPLIVGKTRAAVDTADAANGGASTPTPPVTPPTPDTTKPTISFTSPANNATVSGTVTATAAASDNVGVTKVDLSLDGVLKMPDTASPYNYSFDSKTLTNGSHTLTAKAYDAAGNTATTTITVTVSNPDTTAPNAPTNLNATAPNATTVNLTWTAATDTGSNPTGVTKYNVLRNGVVIAQPTTTSYSDTSRAANTTYSYTVQAVDGAGNTSASSSAVSVTTPAGSTSDLLFNGTKISDYFNQSAPGAVTAVADPLGSNQQVFKMVVKNTDVAPVTPTADPRAQLLSPSIINNGDDFWWSSKFLLPNDFPSSVPGWINILEGAYGPPFNGSPPWEVQANGTNLAWVRNGTYGYDVPWSMPIVKNQWISVVIHEKLSSSGFVEMWVNGQQVTFFPSGSNNYNPSKVVSTTRLAMQTWDNSNNGGANFAVIQSYRKLGMFDSVTLYQWPMKLGTTQASVTDTTPPPSTADTTAPTTPIALGATAASVKQVNLTWNASTDIGSGIAGYNIYRNGTKLNSSPVSTTSYGDSTVSANTSYSYKIEAVDGSGNKSVQTSAVSITTPPIVRGDVTGPVGAPDGKINLTDISFIIRNYDSSNKSGDVSGPNGTPDGKVDIYDLSFIIRNYGK